jgi:hypothetical protein
MALFYGLQDMQWGTYGNAVGLFVAFYFCYESLAQLMATFGTMATSMVLFMTIVDQASSYNGIFTRIENTQYPFKCLSYIMPVRQMFVVMNFLTFSDTEPYKDAFECTPGHTAPACMAGSTFYCSVQPCYGRTGQEILKTTETMGFQAEDQVDWRIIILFCYGVAFKILMIVRLFIISGTSEPKGGTPPAAVSATSGKSMEISSA